MNSDRRNKFMGEIDARTYNGNTHVIQSNNQNIVNPNNRHNNNNRLQHKRTIKNNVVANNRHYKRIITRGAAALAALIAAGTITGVVINNNTNKNIDTIHEAYEYTESALPVDERAVKKEGYQDYIETMAALDRVFEISDQKEFHDLIKTLDLKDKVLDSEQITNLALEVFKVAFGEKYDANPMDVKVENREPDIMRIRRRF